MRKWLFIIAHPIRARRFHRAVNAPWPSDTCPHCADLGVRCPT